jgi:hypothetical protein
MMRPEVEVYIGPLAVHVMGMPIPRDLPKAELVAEFRRRSDLHILTTAALAERIAYLPEWLREMVAERRRELQAQAHDPESDRVNYRNWLLVLRTMPFDLRERLYGPLKPLRPEVAALLTADEFAEFERLGQSVPHD